MTPNNRRLNLIVAAAMGLVVFPVVVEAGDEPLSAVGSVMKLLKSGRVPPSRLGPVFEQIARRGNEHDLAYLFKQASATESYDAELRLTALRLLAEAASRRGVRPAGDLSSIAALIRKTEDDPVSELHLTALRLAGLWKVESAAGVLQTIVLGPDAPPPVRGEALRALAAIGGPRAREVIVELTGTKQPIALRMEAVAALSGLDVRTAAERAAVVLTEATAEDDPSGLVKAFLDRKGGSETLAGAIEQSPPSADVAKLALRTIYAVGRSDPELSGVLGRIAGIDADPKPPTREEILRLVPRVVAEGDAARGEGIFRRADLSCMKCHSVSKAGGQVGPDLSAVGASSPVDYLLSSVFDPDQQIKEAFQTRVVMTSEGLVHHGILIDRTDEGLVLKEATGEVLTVPENDIEAEMEGKSLMPKGLTKFMTEAEILDLVRFLSMLGKPNTEYAIRETQRMQRWRVLQNVSQSFIDEIPAMSPLQKRFGRDRNIAPAYSRVNGELPLEALAAQSGAPVVYVMGAVEVTQGGEIGVRVNSAVGLTMWLNEQMSNEAEWTTELARGRYAIMIRVDTRERSAETLTLELFRVPGSKAEFTVVDGA